MIQIDVKDYCHTCTEFDPDVEYPTNIYANNEVALIGDTIVRCKDRRKCENIKCHLKFEELKRRTGDDQN